MHVVNVDRQDATLIHIEIWTDNTKFLPDGVTPDPAFIFVQEYNINPPPGLTLAAYESQCITNAEALAGVYQDPNAANYDQAATGAPLPPTGTTY